MPGFKSRFDGKFLTDTAWNYAAFAVMAVTGVILNFFIAARLGIEVLGVFNQIYAIYIIVAQFAVFGVHDSAQKHNAEFMDPENRTMLRIEAEDNVQAGSVFELLMGDQVEPRKAFIQQHAADVQNLDF